MPTDEDHGSQFKSSPSGQFIEYPDKVGQPLAVQPGRGRIKPTALSLLLALPGLYPGSDAGKVLGINTAGQVVPLATSVIDVPLTDVRFADAQTSVPESDQNGSQGLPFTTITAAREGLPEGGGVIYATPEDYTAEGTIAIGGDISILSLGQPGLQSAEIDGLNLSAGIECGLGNLDVQTLHVGAGTVVLASACEFAAITGSADLSLYQQCDSIGTIACEALYAQQSVINGNVTLSGTTCIFDDCEFGASVVISFAAPGGIVQLNGTSYREFLGAGGTVVNGSIRSNDFLPPAANVAALATGPYANVPNGQGVLVLSDGYTYKSVPVGTGQTAGTGNDWRRDLDFGDLPPILSNSSNVLGAWSSHVAAAANVWNGVAFGNNLFVAVSDGGVGNRVMTSPDGSTWTSRVSAADNTWTSVAFGNGLFVAVAFSGAGNRVMTSPDGITWTIRASAADNQWLGVAYGNGLFVAVANSGVGNRVMTSPDGITWTIRASAADNNWGNVCFGNGLFVAVAFSGAGNRVMTSPDGITWTLRVNPVDSDFDSICFGNGLFVAVAEAGAGDRVMTSRDGITWTNHPAAAASAWTSVIFGNGLFVAVAASGANCVMTSSDGSTWTARVAAETDVWASVTFGNGRCVAVANTGANRVMTADLAPASANLQQGQFTMNGTTAVPVAFAGITGNNFVVLNASSLNATPSVPMIAITAGTGFTATGNVVGDTTSVWNYRVI